MKKKRILKWLLGLFLAGVMLLVIFLLSLDTILRVMVVHNVRTQTGMKVEIGKFHIGLLEPVMTIKDLKLYNPPGFGDGPLIEIPEIHVEYDREALKRNEIHVTLLRFNLGELDIVKNAAGKTNLFELGLSLPSKDDLTKNKNMDELKKRGLEFGGIDLLTVSVGTAKYIDQQDPKNSREENIGIENIPLRNVKSEADLVGLMALVALKGSDVFGVLVDKKAGGGNTQLLNSLF